MINFWSEKQNLVSMIGIDSVLPASTTVLTRTSCELWHCRMMQQHMRLWSTMECNQPAAWTTNRSLLVASRVKALSGRPTNSGSSLPRAAHLDGGVIGCHRCITSNSGNAPASHDISTTPLGFVPHAYHTPSPSMPPPKPP